jgi:hypothetical protein
MTKILCQKDIDDFFKSEVRRSKKLSKKLIEQNSGRGKSPSRKDKK